MIRIRIEKNGIQGHHIWGVFQAKFPKTKFWEHGGTRLSLFYRIDTNRRNSRNKFQDEFRPARGSTRNLKTENWLKIENGEHPNHILRKRNK